LATTIFFARPPNQDLNGKPGGSLCGSFLSTAFLTLTNPATIISFIGAFAGLGIIGSHGRYDGAGALVLGVFFGSALWWLLLSHGVGLFATRVNARGLVWINRISSMLIAGLGLISLAWALR
jgi:arginine exporter protein ArgO